MAKPTPTPAPKMTIEEAMAMIDRHAAEEEVAKAAAASPNKKKVAKAKDALKAGAKQGRGGLGRGTQRQLDALEKEGY